MGEEEKEREREPMNIELLSPAGSYQGLQAVIRAGADAVYIGGSRFGARAYADNPDVEELKEAIDFTHIHGKKIYLAVNTLLKNQELYGQLYDFMAPFMNREQMESLFRTLAYCLS